MHDVLDEFPAVGLQNLPFLVDSDAPVGDGGVAPLVLTDTGLHVGEPAETVSTEQLEQWCGQQQWASETRRSAYIVYGQFFAHLHERTGIANPAKSLTSPPPPPREPRPAPEEAIADALETTEPRVASMIHLGATLGLRIGEIVLIHRDDAEPNHLTPTHTF